MSFVSLWFIVLGMFLIKVIMFLLFKFWFVKWCLIFFDNILLNGVVI